MAYVMKAESVLVLWPYERTHLLVEAQVFNEFATVRRVLMDTGLEVLKPCRTC